MFLLCVKEDICSRGPFLWSCRVVWLRKDANTLIWPGCSVLTEQKRSQIHTLENIGVQTQVVVYKQVLSWWRENISHQCVWTDFIDLSHDWWTPYHRKASVDSDAFDTWILLAEASSCICQFSKTFGSLQWGGMLEYSETFATSYLQSTLYVIFLLYTGNAWKFASFIHFQCKEVYIVLDF